MGVDMINVLIGGEGMRGSPLGGVARMMSEISEAVSVDYDDIRLSYTWPGEGRKPGGGVRIFRPSRLFFSDRLGPRIDELRFAFRRKPDIFHASSYEAPPRGFSGKYVVTLHDFVDREMKFCNPNFGGFVQRQFKAILDADCVVSVSDSSARKAIEYTGIDPKKIAIANPGVSEFWFEEGMVKESLSKFGSFWLFVGGRGSYKNFSSCLRAFSSVAKETNTHLVVVGGGPNLEAWENDFVVQSGIGDRVHLLGQCTDEFLRALYQQCISFIYPSLSEGFGIPLIEAMAYGAQVIASDIDVFREVAGDHATYFNAESFEELAEKMRKILGPSDILTDQEGRINWAKQYTWGKAAKVWAEQYRKII